MKKLFLVASVLLAGAPAFAQHVHQKGPNGGPLEDVAGVHVEMVTSGRTLTFNIFDEANKPVPSKGFSGSARVSSGSERETLPLVVADNALKADAKKDIAPGSTISITLKAADGKSGQAKFKR